MRIVVGHDNLVGAWVSRQLGSLWVLDGGRALGWIDAEGALVAGVVFTQFNGSNVVLECAALPKTRWLNRSGLWAIFSFTFEQLKCRRVTALTSTSNAKSLKLLKQAGFVEEARLKRAAPNGEDLIAHVMFREDCKWLKKSYVAPTQ